MRRLFILCVLGCIPALLFAAPDSSGIISVPLTKRDTGTFYLPGKIHGFGEIQFLMDTGSSYMVVGASVIEKLKADGAATFSRDIRGTMADGRPRVVPLYRISALRLGESCWVDDVEVAVLEAGNRAILGMDVLSRLAPFTFSTQPPQLGLSGCRPNATDALAEASRDTTPTP